MLLRISNYKLRTHIFGKNLLSVLQQKGRRVKNFYIIKQQFTYAIYTNGTVNITKVRNYNSQKKAILQELTELFPQCVVNETFFLDNITASSHYSKPIDLYRLTVFPDLKKYLSCSGTCIDVKHQCNARLGYKFLPERFPGLFLYSSHVTIIVFSSGALVFVGETREKALFETLNQLERLLNHVMFS